jgi:hypothetical protein
MVPKRVVLTLILAVLKWIRPFDLVNTSYPMGLSTGSEAFFIPISLQKPRLSPKVLARGDLSLLLQDTFGS